ncbi:MULTISPECIES: hypothetical protein [Nonomuraea]|uniref:hypothetical protein n=1 Tax=Nonomuraea TaxID=83681 RepID=UPI001C5E4FE6|nr:hypothetical protein [Nonomuraea ceibae]
MPDLKKAAQIMAGGVVVLLVIAVCATAVGIFTSVIGIGFGRGFMFGAGGTAIAMISAWFAVRRQKRE